MKYQFSVISRLISDRHVFIRIKGSNEVSSSSYKSRPQVTAVPSGSWSVIHSVPTELNLQLEDPENQLAQVGPSIYCSNFKHMC